MIDHLEAIIQWLDQPSVLAATNGRVADKHRFGLSGGWTKTATCLSVHLDGGTPDRYAPVQTSRYELRIYGNDNRETIMGVYQDLVTLERTESRFEVTTENGTALVQYFKRVSGLSFVHDPDLKMDVGLIFCEAMVAETAIT